jgi:hypothetical protein
MDMNERHELVKRRRKPPIAGENVGDTASETERKKTVTVKDVPPFDPDAEAASMIYTIPAWVNSLERIFARGDFSQVSFDARYKLRKELTALICAAETLIDITNKQV